MRGTARQNSELAIKTDLCILVRCWNIESEMNRQWMVCHAFLKSDQRGVSVSLKGSISFLQAVGLNKKQMLSPDPLKLCRALKANTQLLSPRLTHHFTSQIKCLLKSGHIICDIYGRFFSCCSIMDKDNPWRQNSSPTKNQIPHLFLLSKQTKKTRICVCGEVSKCQVLVPSGTWGETKCSRTASDRSIPHCDFSTCVIHLPLFFVQGDVRHERALIDLRLIQAPTA